MLGIPIISVVGKTNADLLLPPELLLPRSVNATAASAFVARTVAWCAPRCRPHAAARTLAAPRPPPPEMRLRHFCLSPRHRHCNGPDVPTPRRTRYDARPHAYAALAHRVRYAANSLLRPPHRLKLAQQALDCCAEPGRSSSPDGHS